MTLRATAGASGQRAWTAAQVAVLAVFALSRWAYRDLGVQFDASPPYFFIQYLHPWFVAHDFLRSILYLHHQAPLQILVAQGCIKLLGLPRATLALECLYRGLGLSLSLALVRVLRMLGAGPVLTAVAVSLYVASPTFVLYENWLFYPLPTAALLVFALAALLRYERLGTFGSALLFFGLLGTLALLRATYGSLFLCVATGIVLTFPRNREHKPTWTILKAAAVPLVIVTLNAAKTSWLVGHPYGGALLWANLPLKVFVQLPVAERIRLLDRGLVSGAAGYHGVATDVDAYGPFKVAHAPTGVALLDRDHLPDGANNAHALEHVLVAEKVYRADAVYLLTHYPRVYFESVWVALSTQYVASAARADGLEGGLDFRRVAPVRAAVERGLGVDDSEHHRLLALVFAFPMAILYGLYRLSAVRGVSESQRSSAAAIAFSLFAIVYTGAVTLLVSYGDFGRYRFEVDPLYLVLVVLGLSDASNAAAQFGRRVVARLTAWRGRGATRVGPGTEAPVLDA